MCFGRPLNREPKRLLFSPNGWFGLLALENFYNLMSKSGTLCEAEETARYLH
jgi:hypothetical protein